MLYRGAFWVWQSYCTHRLTAALPTWTRPGQRWVHLHFIMGQRRAPEVQPLPEGLPATISSQWWLGKGMPLSPGVDSPVSCLYHPPPPRAHAKGPWLISVGLIYTKAWKQERELMRDWFQLEKAEGAWERITGVLNDLFHLYRCETIK